MDETVALCHYSVESNRRRVTFRLASPKSSGKKDSTTAVGNLGLEKSPSHNHHRDHWIFKMLCSKFCIVLLIVKVFLLGVILPVHLQHTTDYHNPPDPPNYDEVSQHNNHGDHNLDTGSNGVTTEHSEGNQVAPPPEADDHQEHDVTESTKESDGGDSESGSSSDIIVKQHIADEPNAAVVNHEGDETHSTQETHESETEASQVSADLPVHTEEATTGGDQASSNSCPLSSSISTEQLSEKLDNLMSAIQNIDQSIDKMESLMQSTVVDERIFKCIAAITTGNDTLALKYWNEILRYQDSAAKKNTVMTQIIKECYAGKEENIVVVLKFIEKTQHFYGYSILHKEMVNYGQIFGNRRVFTLASYVQKSCGRNSKLFKSLPQAVQSVYADFFTLQSKFNKGYLYYAKRCVARHYYYCLDVLTKRIEADEMEVLDGDEKRRYHWKLNATDETASKFFILNKDKYWSYRLQSLNNSPRFKMEEAGSIFEIEWAHFQLLLHSENEIAIQVRDANVFLEGEEFKLNNTNEVLLHSFYKTEHLTESDKIYWLVKPVNGVDHSDDDTVVEHENCSNGNGERR